MKQTDSVHAFLFRCVSAVLLAGVLCVATSCKKGPGGGLRSKQGGFPGYTLVQQLGSKATNLIDAEGRVVHRWVSNSSLAGGTYLLENGNLLRSCVPANSVQRNATPGLSGLIELLDWDGNQLWSYQLSNDENCLHHDIEPLPNGNILMLALEQLSSEEQISLGRDPARATSVLKLDYIVEMKPEGKEGGPVVWEWHLKDHLIQDFDKTKKNFGVVSDHPEKVDINFIENLKKMNASNLRVMQSLGYVASTAKITPQRSIPDWTHANAVAYHAGLNQILISIRSLSEVWIIDHGTTTAEAKAAAGGKMNKGGDLLYRWGNPQSYQSGAPSDQQLYGQHDAQWIPPGRPGEGNILIFNNGEGRKEGDYSSIEEIKPPLKQDGSYEWMKGEAFAPAKSVWRYASEKKDEFTSSFLSGVQRLPNGNTLICSGVQGRMFEVTQDGSIDWEHKMDITMRNSPSQGQRPGAGPGPGAGKGPGARMQRPGMRPGMRGPGGGAAGMNAGPGAQGKPGVGSGVVPGIASGAAPGVAEPSAVTDGTTGAAKHAESSNTFTAAELAVLNGTPLQPPAGFAGPNGGAGGLPGGGMVRGPRGQGGGAAGGGGLFRATRYGLDYPAFKGRKLEPLGQLPAPPAK